ncbi:sensor histidine kinase [Halovivax gelatinilyticus]|uniref:sensor histidine kinase n=1 Tax=Halovivax gelatinilyticus TaxID=2961597 RepID=UPI0020CA8BCF|nr:HAMP domain-containing sensor histidine kinase [Halovivax gelatinilyticus]
MAELESLISLSPAKISAGYFTFGLFWIPTTDVALAVLFQSQQLPTAVGLAKGWIFVGMSTVLIFTLTHFHRRQMGAAQEKLQRTNQQLQVFHRVFRHNIRNDLNVIRGYAETVSSRVTQPELREQLDHVIETTGDLLTISEKLKVVEQVDSSPDEQRSVDLARLVDAELDRLQGRYPGITISKERSPNTVIDAGESIRYAIREVLENAISHFDADVSDCEIAVDISASDDGVDLTICDNGPGLPDAELRAIRRQRETPLMHTSSVGLWVVTWLAELNDGGVDYRQDGDAGLSVTFEFQPSRVA